MSIFSEANKKDRVKISSAFDLRLKSNNFDLLRFLFAFVVFLVHSSALSETQTLSILSNSLSSAIAVKCFFVVSGFLIFMSYENSSDTNQFFMKRARRIYPAYFSIVLICAFLGSIFSTYSWSEYWSFPLLKYIAANLVFLNFLQPNLPGLFENNTLQAVNGALWTLKIEVMFYLFVPLAVMAFRKFGRLVVIIALYFASILYSVIIIELVRRTGVDSYMELQRQLPGQLSFFLAGAIGYYYFQYLAKYGLWLLVLAIAAFVLQAWLPWIVLEPVALGIVVVYFACIFPCMGNFGKYGDFSYGMYIVHFPILQILISFGLFKESPWLMLTVAGLLILTIAILFWNFIEKPFLRKSSHYVAVNQVSAA
ncbi:MAG: acyltransferase [Methylobacter sp.]|nr:acyltransferase [Methylobacter sp.]